jgi:uncharacterized phage-associated protein
MHEDFKLDSEKFKDVVHYVVHHVNATDGRDALGNTKLHKVLYYSDVLHFLDKGRPLTGADYLRQRFGPTARCLSSALRELEQEKRVSVSHRNYYGYSKCDYDSLKEFRSNRLSTEERDLIQHVVSFVCKHTAHEISEFSHDDVWASVPMGERIPYYAAYAIFPAEVSDEDIREATSEVIALAPKIQRGKREGRVV